jgi:hypothetical protein
MGHDRALFRKLLPSPSRRESKEEDPMMHCTRTLALVALAILVAPAAFALPTVSVGSPVSVEAGSSFSVDILISGVEAGSPLNAFEFDLLFDGSVLSATSVSDGGFLLAPVFQLQNSVGAVRVEFAEVTLLPSGASGAGVLATIGFDALLPGVSVLDLTNVVLSAPFGIQIATAAVLDGSVSVLTPGTPGSVVPEPSAMALWALGFSVVGLRLRRRRG